MDYRAITWEEIEKACEGLNTTPIKTKDKTTEYVQVNERVKAFRKLYPTGYILTEIVSIDNGICIVRAEAGFYDDDKEKYTLATGTAYEKENSSFINKTSYIENCETSAIGRALAFIGIGISKSISSAEEVENATLQQAQQKIISPGEAEILKTICKENNIDEGKLFKQYKVKGWEEFTAEQYVKICKQIEKHKELQRAAPLEQ